MNESLKRVENAVKNRRLFTRGQKILVAVSGGADSMALLQVLHQLSARQHWKLSVAHFNHQLRSPASDRDEKFVCAAAKKLSLPVFSARGDVAGLARHSKISVEMAARQLRHEFLARVARQNHISTIALAHHADDQVELFFLRLLRGSGGEGLAGMKWRSPSPADSKITLVRPLLGFSKAELLEFLGDQKIRFRHDATNFSTDYLRNRIRNELLPLLRQKYQSGLTKSVLRVMDIIGAESEFVSEVAQQWLIGFGRRRSAGTEMGKTVRKSSGARKFPAARAGAGCFENLPLAVQRRGLQMRLAEIGIPADFGLVEKLRTSPGDFVSINASYSVARTGAGTLICRESSRADFKPAELRIFLKQCDIRSPRDKSNLDARAGQVSFGGCQYRWQIHPQKKFVRPNPRPGTEAFDADRVGPEIILRHWRAGDRFQPIGLKSPVKLQDLFVNAKIPAAHRRELVLATTASGDIFWVEGLRISEAFKLTARTKAKLVWNWKKTARQLPVAQTKKQV